MSIDEAIEIYVNNAEYARTHGDLKRSTNFKQFSEWLKELKLYREMIPSASEVFLDEIRSDKK